MRDVAAGSEDALAALYDRHADAVFAVATRLTPDRQVAEEVVQETFLALWNRAELFDPAAGSLAAWLNTIARNRTVDRMRAAGRRPSLVSFGAVGLQDDVHDAAIDRVMALNAPPDRRPADPEGALEAAELRDALRSALRTMPGNERDVIVLAYQEDLSQAQIARRLAIPIGTVKTRTRRALHRLRTVLGPDLRPTRTVPAPGAAETAVVRGDADGPR